ncbi:MAG TPA: sigma-70 family RNA polymerase sigma factor [Longimicrobiales bacterium]|nr:sigma-70 family RNA polymerase sigma factor [Longimicrobiales bacterium]
MQPIPLSDRSDSAARPRLDDSALLLRIQTGDAASLAELMRRYWTPLVRYAARLLESRDAAEDMAQQAFFVVWSKRARYRAHGTAQAYLYRIVRNEALQELRRRQTRQRAAGDVARGMVPESTPFELTTARELDDALQRALAALSPRRREAFVLSRYHDLSLDEVAAVMSISPQTAANHVSVALAELRSALADFLG